ncbi:MAG: hypothetical protein L6R37_006266 [Teloschistes peruensis]|nr:MAG: hypothetical protein L6R37_006266 [Teloschistes peruensis]
MPYHSPKTRQITALADVGKKSPSLLLDSAGPAGAIEMEVEKCEGPLDLFFHFNNIQPHKQIEAGAIEMEVEKCEGPLDLFFHFNDMQPHKQIGAGPIEMKVQNCEGPLDLFFHFNGMQPLKQTHSELRAKKILEVSPEMSSPEQTPYMHRVYVDRYQKLLTIASATLKAVQSEYFDKLLNSTSRYRIVRRHGLVAQSRLDVARILIAGEDEFTIPLIPGTTPPELLTIRHRSSIERVLAALRGMDPKLDSAILVRWLRAPPNSWFIEVLPEVALKMGDGLQHHKLIQDSLAVLTGERALDDLNLHQARERQHMPETSDPNRYIFHHQETISHQYCLQG